MVSHLYYRLTLPQKRIDFYIIRKGKHELYSLEHVRFLLPEESSLHEKLKKAQDIRASKISNLTGPGDF
jgi:hypothetical protein